ncbi:hypothetical protein [Thalassobacillus devorans]|nr:hypothetical protein [Thalassobacillus devorans]
MAGVIVLVVMCSTVLAAAHSVVKENHPNEPHSIQSFNDYFIK